MFFMYKTNDHENIQKIIFPIFIGNIKKAIYFLEGCD